MSGGDGYVLKRIPRRETVEIRGLEYRITRWGPPDVAPIVLLHGFMDTGDTWQFVVDELPPSWAFAAPDWRGFGGTAWPEDGYWFPDYFADLDALLNLLTPGTPARLVGHSMGANVATLYAGIRPRRCEWVVNLEGFGLSRTRPEDAPERYVRWLDEVSQPLRRKTYASSEALAATLVERNPRLDAARASFIARAWTQPLDPRGAGDAAAGRVVLAHDPRHRRINPVLYRREEAEACWARIEAPVLMVLAAHSEVRDMLGPEVEPQRLRKFFRDFELIELADASHMMHHERPDAIAKIVAAFVERLAGRAKP